MRRWLIYFSFLLFLGTQNAEAQRFHARLDAGLGGLIRHSKKFQFPSDEWTKSIDLSAQWFTHDRQGWAKYYNYPNVGAHLRFHTFGNRSILGGAVSLYPSITIPFSRNQSGRRWDFMYGSGLSYVFSPFDPLENPINTAIGTRWNTMTRIKFQYSFPVKAYRLGIFADFTHVSNGRMSTPNTGLNTAELGLSIWPSREERSFPDLSPTSFSIRKWSVEAAGVLAWTSQSNYPGPKFPVYVVKMAVTRSITPVQRLHLGVEWERNMERAHFQSGMLGVVDRREALQYATAYLLYLGDEFVIGPVSFGVVAGIYIQTRRETFPIYNQLFARYYFIQNERHSGAFLTVYLKSHLATAQYLGFGLGYQL